MSPFNTAYRKRKRIIIVPTFIYFLSISSGFFSSSFGEVAVHGLTPPLDVVFVGLDPLFHGAAGRRPLQLFPDEIRIVVVLQIRLLLLVHGLVAVHVLRPLILTPGGVLHHLTEFLLFRLFRGLT